MPVVHQTRIQRDQALGYPSLDANIHVLLSVVPGIIYSSVNKDVATVLPGQVIALDPSGSGFIRACAADTTAPAYALSLASIAPLAAGNCQRSNLVTLADWTAVTGTVNLVAMAVYYLDAVNPGQLTNVAPSGGGRIVQQVGITDSPTTLEIAILDYTLLA